MRVTLVNPLYNSHGGFVPQNAPLGLLVLQEILMSKGIASEVVDLNMLNNSNQVVLDKDFYSNAAKYILQNRPNVVGFTAMSNNYINVVLLAKEIKNKQPDITILLGGPQASFVAKETLCAFSWIDIICKGESENTIELLARYFEGQLSLHCIPNIVYREKEDIKETQIAKMLPEESLPTVNYSWYINSMSTIQRESIEKLSVEGGRGCPYNCIFCSTSTYWSRKFRLKNIDRLIDEIVSLCRCNKINKVSINHDLFTCNREKVIEFCNEIKNYKIQWSCSSRIDVLDDELICLMKDSGCTDIFFGIESGDANVQAYINKKLDLHQAEHTIRSCIERKIGVVASFIIGFPDESLSSINNTLKTIIKYRIIGVKVNALNILVPEHGSELMKRFVDNLKFEENVFYKNHDAILINKEYEISLIKQYPKLFNHFYVYKSEEFNYVSLLAIKRVFEVLIKYFKYTLNLMTSYYDLPIIESIFKCMKWDFQGHLSSEKLSEIQSTADICCKFHDFVYGSEFDEITRCIYKYERDLYEFSNGLYIDAQSSEVQENKITANFAYNYNVSYVIYCMKYNMALPTAKEDFKITRIKEIIEGLSFFKTEIMRKEVG